MAVASTAQVAEVDAAMRAASGDYEAAVRRPGLKLNTPSY